MLLSILIFHVQKRASSSSMLCPEGRYVHGIFENGTVMCDVDQNDGGDVTAVNVGNGLLGGGSYGDVSVGVDYGIVQHRISSKCPAGSAIRAILANGTVECELDNDGGDVTSLTVGNGLTGGGDVGDISVSINTSRTYNVEYNKNVTLANIFVVSIKMVP